MATIQFEHVVKRFGETLVLPDLDLTIADREFFTFVGPSGCGKSTILGLVAGLEPLSGGNLRFDGQQVNHLPPRDRDVAMVFQSYALYPHLTVFENIAFPLRVRKADKETVARAVRDVAGHLDLQMLLHRKPRELSGGQRQRVALGRALIRQPKAFLMDEPLSNLDARLRIETRAELKRLHQEYHVTTIYVTHDQEEAMALSDHIAVLHQGSVQQIGTPEEIYHRPANRFVGGFVGSPPMNFLDGNLLKSHPAFAGLFHEHRPEDVDYGVRPSDATVNTASEGAILEIQVMAIEPVGRDTWVDGTWQGQLVKGCLAPGANVMPGARAFVHAPMERLHAFDKSSGRIIRPR